MSLTHPAYPPWWQPSSEENVLIGIWCEGDRDTHIESMSTFSSEANSPRQAHMVHGKLFVDTGTNKSMDALSLSSEANLPQEAHTASG